MGHELSAGAVAQISEGGGEGTHPVLQISDVRLVSTAQNTTERYRMLLSDGIHTQQAMLATQLNTMVKSGSLQTGSIVRLNEYICNQIQGRRIIIVIQLELLQSECKVIGTPRLYESGASPSLGNTPASGTSPQTHSTGQIPQTGSSMNPRPQPPSNSPSYNATTNVRNMMNQPSLQNPRPNNPNLNPSNHSNNSLYSASTNVRNMMNQPNLQSAKPDDPSLNQSFQFRPPASTVSSSKTYSRTAQQSPFQQQPPPLYVNRGPIAKNEAPAVIFPISRLNPFQGRWTIKSRVISKGELRTYNNPKGDGKLFSFDLIDSEGGEIRVTCFNSAAEQYYPIIEFGKVYLISKGSIKPANKKYNMLNHEYEMTLDSGSMVEPCEDDSKIPGVTFNFRQISDIELLPSETILEVIGVVISISPASIVMKKNGTETVKRSLQLKDMSGRSVEVSLWGSSVNSEGQQLQSMCDSGQFPILAIKGGRVNDFNGKTLSCIPGSQLFVEPDCVEAQQLRDWYNMEGKSASTVSISFQTGVNAGRADNRKTASQIKDEGLGHGEKPDYITVKGTVTFITVDNFYYTACPLTTNNRQCNKKVTNNGDGTWRCDKCDQNFQECDYRYLLNFHIQDHTGIIYVTAFQDAGEQIMGMPAKDLYLIKYEEQDDTRFSEIIRGVLYKQFILKLKVKEEMYNDEQRVKSTVVGAENVDPSTESKYLLGLIDKMLLEDKNPNQNLYQNTVPGNVEARPNLYVGGREQQMAYCNSCGSSGHNALNCPVSMNRQVGGGGGGGFANRPINNSAVGGGGGAGFGSGNDTTVCFKCQQPGHWARDCPNMAGGGGGGGAGMGSGNDSTVCFKCQQPGHWARDCPNMGAGGGGGAGMYGSGNVPSRYGNNSYVGSF